MKYGKDIERGLLDYRVLLWCGDLNGGGGVEWRGFGTTSSKVLAKVQLKGK